MYDVLPHLMASARRGICPTCGAPMRLAESGRDVACDYCGGQSSLSFRLRAIEPDAVKLERAKIKGATRALSKHATYEPCTCPGCGATFDADTSQSIQACKYCGAQSKLETRLVPITTDDVAEPQERTREDFKNEAQGRLDYPWEVETEQLCWRVLTESDLESRIALAGKFRRWGYINHTSAHFLPWLLTVVNRDVDDVAFRAVDVVGKLLCEGSESLWPGAIQSCRGVVFDVNSHPAIMHELGLGKAVCVKTLIDTAEFASVHGAREYAANALWAVNTLIGRSFDEHPLIAQIVLYRLFYVTGAVLGWALDAMRSSYLRGRYPIEVLAQAVDEFAIERPEVVPHLLDCFYVVDAKTPEEYDARLDFIRKAISWGGKAAGFEVMGAPPESDAVLYAEAIRLIDEHLDDPDCGAAAECALYRMITRVDGTSEPVQELVRKRREALSYRIKREFIRRNPETELLDTSEPYYWQSDPKRDFDPAMQREVDAWKEDIRTAVDRYRERSQAVYAKQVKKDVPVFLREGPATIPLGQEYVRRQEAQAAEEERVEQTAANINSLNEEYMARINELSERMMANMGNRKLMQECSEEMQRLAAELQEKMTKLTEES